MKEGHCLLEIQQGRISEDISSSTLISNSTYSSIISSADHHLPKQPESSILKTAADQRRTYSPNDYGKQLTRNGPLFRQRIVKRYGC